MCNGRHARVLIGVSARPGTRRRPQRRARSADFAGAVCGVGPSPRPRGERGWAPRRSIGARGVPASPTLAASSWMRVVQAV
ncbi:MAG: hypothetical protein EKK42_00170 [Pseudonocardiaceae bacterium]|nr:MAG: hypothetical protein EKK42_00170 [Pseudonocardiaceae bacterium]